MIDITIIVNANDAFDSEGFSQNVSVQFVPRVGELVEFGFRSNDYQITEVNHYFGSVPPSIELIAKEVS